MREIVARNLCYGCGACMQSCPVNCISMKEDRAGFLYPVIDEKKCINCRRCKEICISDHKKDENSAGYPNCYIGVNKDEEIWMNSSSGGAFSAIVKALEIPGFVVFGAEYNDKNEVCHSYVEKFDDLERFRKSKYVQSNLKDTFRKAEQFLREGRRVIFSGTPCQIAGLYAALGKEYDNLYTVDLVCTGVMSPLLFKKSISVLEKKYGNTVKKIDMRYKVKGKEGWNIGDTEVIFSDDKRLRNKATRCYRQIYGQKIAYRERCYNCQFAKINRVSDITIGDWWGTIDSLPEVTEHKGISLLLFNSVKGTDLIEDIKRYMYLSEIDYCSAIKDNPTLRAPTPKTKRCGRFWRDFYNMKDELLLKKYSKPPMNIYIPWLCSRIIPVQIRKNLRKLLKK